MKTALELAERLCRMADAMSENRTVQISDETLRGLRDEVGKGRMQLSETDFNIDYEATCLVECLAELAYARSDRDRRREERALMYLNSFRTFLRIDVNDALRKVTAQ